ncbi:hypothetical protein L1987_44822 [Smallanthus sonchifolius]|uniref:Uncharacterized protein n=1 Tax=Smallanthus sonchifolius TaxID=185202 RepID=A0ACB9GR94_9ASTR|nr:hypothetical protein L1987_44822 [Smallanthus sonchifolius]
MKIETLESHVERMKREKAVAKQAEIEKDKAQAKATQPESVEEQGHKKKKEPKEKIDAYSRGYDAQSAILKAKVEELNATKRSALNKELIDEVSKEVYTSSSTPADTKTEASFKSLKNPSVTERRQSRFAYSNKALSSRQRHVANSDRAILPQYTDAMERNTI